MKKPVFVSGQDAASNDRGRKNSSHDWNDPGICK